MSSASSLLERYFEGLGASKEQSKVMSQQLIKRANQVAEDESISEIEAMSRLLGRISGVNKEWEEGNQGRKRGPAVEKNK